MLRDRFVVWLLKSPLHGLISSAVMLVNYTGRRTGKVYAVPVNYVFTQEGLLVMSLKKRVWWRNLTDDTRFTVRLQGKSYSASAEVFETGDDLTERLTEYLQGSPRLVKYFNIESDEDDNLKTESVHEFATDRVVVRFRVQDK